VKGSSSSSLTAASAPEDPMMHAQELRQEEEEGGGPSEGSGFGFLSQTAETEETKSAFGFLSKGGENQEGGLARATEQGEEDQDHVLLLGEAEDVSVDAASTAAQPAMSEASQSQGSVASSFSFLHDAASQAGSEASADPPQVQAAIIKPSAVRKKRGTRKPGFARSESNEEETDHDAGQDIEEAPPNGDSILKGLTIHASTEEEDVRGKGKGKEMPSITPKNSSEDQAEAEIEGKTEEDPTSAELKDLLKAFKRAASQFEAGIKRVKDDTASSSARLEQVEDEKRELQARTKKLEQEQNEALEAEDFDTADRLQRTIDALGRTAGEIESRKHALSKQLDSLRAAKEKIFRDQVDSIDVIAELLNDCCKREGERAKKLEEDSRRQRDEEAKRLDDEDELLRIEMEGIENDLEVVEREQEQINTKVDAGTVELREERGNWEEKIAAIDEEIAELERQLAVKMDEKEKLSCHLDKVNAGIQSARSRYESRLTELEERRAAIDAKSKAAEHRVERISMEKEALKDREANDKEMVSFLDVSAHDIASQLTILKTIAMRFRKVDGDLEKDGDGVCEHAEHADVEVEIKKLEDEIDVTNHNVDFNKKKLSETENELVELRRKLFDIESKLPALEEQKKLAVSARNFKEAGRVASLIKDATADKEAHESLIEEANINLEQVKTVIAEKSALVEDLSSKLQDLQGCVNQAKLEKLQSQRKALHDLASNVRASGSVARNTFGATVLQIIHAEADVCEEEAKLISLRMCGDESLAELSEEDDANEHAISTKNEEESSGEEAEKDGAVVEKGEELHRDAEVASSEREKDADEEEVEKKKEIEAKISGLEENLGTAIEEEDFDEADKINAEIESLKSKIP